METSQQSSQVPGKRGDTITLWAGILFSFVFTGIIWLTGNRLNSIELLPDQGAAWYYWKLPNPTFWTQFTAWGFYVIHQVGLWYLILTAQRQKLKYSTKLHRVNAIALIWNAAFIIIHLLQTHFWYDGLAQNVPVWSSQGSVIVLLVWVLLMENNRRGLFWGKKVSFKQETIQWARKYHGYFFSWAIIYTFWFHPMVSTSGHLIGFFYMFLLMLQSSLFFTRIHLNKYWTTAQEAIVLVHGALVAVMQGNNMWPMFAFGFGGILIITQMHGINLSRTIRFILLGIYIALALLVYGGRFGIAKIFQITWIPTIEYLGVFLLAGLIGGGLFVARKLKPSTAVQD